MLIETTAKRILLYGDSLVYGKVSGENRRLPVTERFSGILQQLLRHSFDVIEEGLRGRTVAGENPFFEDRDGLRQFSPIAGSHLPLELVIILLGTNDCNSKANKTPEEIAEGLKLYTPIINEWVKFMEITEPRLLIVAPPEIDEEHYDTASKAIFGSGAATKAAALPTLYEKVAKEIGAHYLNGAAYCKPAHGDGIHLDKNGNQKLAEALLTKITEIFA